LPSGKDKRPLHDLLTPSLLEESGEMPFGVSGLGNR
jgi:hypothetical protein